MRKKAIVTGATAHLIPILLWIILGITSNQPWYYYALCAALSVVDVINTAVTATRNIREYLHHREDTLC